jgi:hypothetical protein
VKQWAVFLELQYKKSVIAKNGQQLTFKRAENARQQ